MTRKPPQMTMRYAHLRDEPLKRAANVAGRIIVDAEEGTKKAEAVHRAENGG